MFIFLKERYHIHMDALEKPCLVDRYINGVVTGLEQEISFLRGFNPNGQEYRASAGGADAEITVPPIDVCKDFRNNHDLPRINAITRISEHDAGIIESVR
jgi:hypothetical protein